MKDSIGVAEYATNVVLGVEPIERVGARGYGLWEAAKPLGRKVQRVNPVIHQDPPARKCGISPPVGAPLRDTSRVRRSKSLLRHGLNGTNDALIENVPDGSHSGGMPVVMARKQYASTPHRFLCEGYCLSKICRKGLLAKNM